MISGGYTAGPSDVNGLIRVFRAYDGTPRGVQQLVRAASDTASNLELPDLRRAGLELNRLAPKGDLRGAKLRFAKNAPKKLGPDRADLFAGLITALKNSPSLEAREFGMRLTHAWFRQEAVPHGIKGKDFYV